MHLLETKNLKKHFPLARGLLRKETKLVHAVEDVSIDLDQATSLGIAGESGCGKTTLGRMILGLVEPTSGTVIFDGRDIFHLSHEEMKRLRREAQMIFQDPYASLNPRKTVSETLALPFRIHRVADESSDQESILNLLEMVGLSPARSFLDRYPHELSGGQRQRVMIARAISLRPRLVVADEPVSSLDVSVRAGILKLMRNIQKELGLAYVFISHDLAVLRSVCNRVGIMYLGRIVELAQTDEIFLRPAHPYTKILLSATPIPNPEKSRKRSAIIVAGEVPSQIDLPTGCGFHPRCPLAQEICRKECPQLHDLGNGHLVACSSAAS
jgi:oligopeptide/dipeptide ABC transporter ATP-binding protein